MRLNPLAAETLVMLVAIVNVPDVTVLPEPLGFVNAMVGGLQLTKLILTVSLTVPQLFVAAKTITLFPGARVKLALKTPDNGIKEKPLTC